jgi:ferric-dicitrate binding protein FerR (iron transport regulator)
VIERSGPRSTERQQQQQQQRRQSQQHANAYGAVQASAEPTGSDSHLMRRVPI